MQYEPSDYCQTRKHPEAVHIANWHDSLICSVASWRCEPALAYHQHEASHAGCQATCILQTDPTTISRLPSTPTSDRQWFPLRTSESARDQKTTHRVQTYLKQEQLECGPMPNVMVALPNIGGALCSTPQSFADAH